jgi:hypothetical protein
MARRQSSANQGSRNINADTGLEHPFPNFPSRLPTHAIYCTHPAGVPSVQQRLVVMNFAADYSAKKFLDAMIAGQGFKWKAQPSYLRDQVPDTIVTDDEVQIRIPGGTAMEDLLELELHGAELEWELPESYSRQARIIRLPISLVEEREEGDERPTRAKREPKEAKPKIDKTGLVSVAEIAAQMKIEPRDARGSLRKQNVEKPEGGWLWPASKVDEIKKVILQGLK